MLHIPSAFAKDKNNSKNRSKKINKAAKEAFDPDRPPKTEGKLADDLRYGGKIKLTLENLRNSDTDEDNDFSRELKFSLALSYRPHKKFKGILKLDTSKEVQNENGETKYLLEVPLAYLFIEDVALDGLSLQIGRQRFRDNREWLYDAKLDAIRFFYQRSRLLFELSASREGLFNLLDDRQNKSNNYFFNVRYMLTKKIEVGAYTLILDGRSSDNENPVFFGIRSNGEIANDLEYWLELASVMGEDGKNQIRGFGLDVGATYEFDQKLKPSITVGYAFGTGDSHPNDGVDSNFRQTGFQGNSDKLNGVTRFKYYGELFDPELSNMSIFTTGIGIRPTKKSSMDLIYHYYLQDEASKRIRDSDIDANPTGRNKELGSEIDLILGYNGVKNVKMKLALGYFVPHKALSPKMDGSFLASFKIQFIF